MAPVFVANSWQLSQITMPARHAPKFSAKRRATLLRIIFQSWIVAGMPHDIEPCPEYQPDLFEHGDRN